MAIDVSREGSPPFEAAPAPLELGAEDVLFRVPPESLTFATTAEVPFDGAWYGQGRAMAALELGLRVPHRGYNIYVCGLTGTQRETQLADLLRQLTTDQPIPGDRVLVQNFADPDRPRALSLPAGWGTRLRQDMRELVRELRNVLPATFRDETFEDEKERLSEEYGSRGEAINRQLAEHASQAGFAIQALPAGELLFIPLKDGRPMEPPELAALGPSQQEELKKKQRALNREVKSVLREQRTLLNRLGREVKLAERRVAAEAVTPLFDELIQRYPDPQIAAYLAAARDHVLDHLSDFQEKQRPPSFPFPGMVPEAESEVDYEVNVLVDNGGSRGAPVIVESSPTYRNLFGAVERMVDRFGKLVTNFTRITGGSLLRAHGGVVVVNVVDALSEPLVWRALKRCLKTGEMDIESYDPFALFATSSLKPEAMKLQARVVLIGPTELFGLLYRLDDEFRDIFKLRADFTFDDDRGTTQPNFVRQVARIAREESLPAFSADAVARLIECAARTVGDRRKLPSQWDDLGDIMREAAYCAGRDQGVVVTAADVERAVEQRCFRLNQHEVRLREMIRDGVLLVDLDGRKVGQVNGLAVMGIAGYEFGRPSRITAAVSMGSQGVIAVDREAKLSGRTYDKGVLILGGYLRHVYAQDFPLSLSASLSFEQSYSDIDGDSASAAEVFALLSSLSGVPLRQDLAVTGSIDQFGEVQPIGGVNEKVEGFFYTCREIGLTGRHGVLIPARNLDHLILRPEVADAVAAGRFHLYPIRTVDEGIEILTGIRAGAIDRPGTVHAAAARRLRELAEGLRNYAAGSARGGKTNELAAAVASSV